MALTDEQIRKIMQKEIEAKTVLVSPTDLERVKKDHLDNGWELVKETPCNSKIKVTFRKVK